MSDPLQTIAAFLRKSQRFLIATHVNPDGDALGSLLALGHILESMGKDVFYYSEEPVPYIYEFLPGSERLDNRLPEANTVDAAIAVDCGDEFRLGREREKILAFHPLIVMDHHSGHKEFGDLRWVERSRSSTGELIYDLATALGVRPTHEAAFCLYAAIASDTGAFRYPNTAPETFRIARELVLAGVNPAEVAGRLFNNFTVHRLNLLRAALGTLRLFAEERIAVITVTQKMFEETGTTLADTEHFINYALALATVQIAVFMREAKDNRLSVSLRSKGKYDVAKVAALFGGGGHRNAAGVRVSDRRMEDFWNILLKELMLTLAGQDE